MLTFIFCSRSQAPIIDQGLQKLDETLRRKNGANLTYQVSEDIDLWRFLHSPQSDSARQGNTGWGQPMRKCCRMPPELVVHLRTTRRR
jgi:hypothetical protein